MPEVIIADGDGEVCQDEPPRDDDASTTAVPALCRQVFELVDAGPETLREVAESTGLTLAQARYRRAATVSPEPSGRAQA